jgi:hypothetical protein
MIVECTMHTHNGSRQGELTDELPGCAPGRPLLVLDDRPGVGHDPASLVGLIGVLFDDPSPTVVTWAEAGGWPVLTVHPASCTVCGRPLGPADQAMGTVHERCAQAKQRKTTGNAP